MPNLPSIIKNVQLFYRLVNIIPFDEMDYQTNHYYFHYDINRKNLPVSLEAAYETILLPNMTELDLEGMAQKYGLAPAEISGKTDVAIINDPVQIQMRESGRQPVIEIAGHPFYVDIHWGLLRPKDDFSTLGISFNDIDGYLSDDGKNYQITYDPKAHAFKELDYSTITSIPKNVIVVEIPSQQRLDPIGYARKHGLNKNAVLRQNPLRMKMEARTVPWDETPIKEILSNNLKTDLKGAVMRTAPYGAGKKIRQKKGRRI